jgi:hypothetical protein
VKIKRSAAQDEDRLGVLCKTIGPVPLREFRREHAESAMGELPDGLSSASRRQYAQLIS